MTVVLRPSGAGDRDFLARVYASTRADELSAVPFTDEQRAAFLAHQFAAQSAHFATHYGDAACDIVEVDGTAAGRLIVWRSGTEIVVVDIALLPEFREQGVGTGLMQAVLDDADAEGQKVTVHVESFNPAQRLYTRLGFKPVGGQGVYIQMERFSREHGFVADAGGPGPRGTRKMSSFPRPACSSGTTCWASTGWAGPRKVTLKGARTPVPSTAGAPSVLVLASTSLSSSRRESA